MAKYDHQKIEKKWQDSWEKSGIYNTKDEIKGKKNLYHLVMFPYPSGDLHLGHWYNYAGADFRARLMRMKGFNVMNPIGFDAFGLPAENAAIKNNVHPKDWTDKNIERMRSQLKTIGACFDWDREVTTSDPNYYKWTQWMFLFMYNNGLAYKKKQVANWCPSCNTVLANEQVVGDGVCERCKTQVEQRELDQWMLRITDYADALVKDLEKIDWPEKTKTMQRNWVGRSEGAEALFKTKDTSGKEEDIWVFTTRPDTLFGATFMVLAPEHPLVQKITVSGQKKAVEEYITKTLKKTELQRMEEEGKDKTGVDTGAKAINPVNGKEIPIYISDYVLMGYGHGAIMAVPAHDQRDWDFATKYKLPIIEVLAGGNIKKEAFTEDGKHVNSEYLNGLGKQEAIDKVIAELSKKKCAKKAINYKLRDWIISRQRYWGAPIPIINCEKCGEVPVPENDLPVELPYNVKFKPTGESPLKYSKEFMDTTCPKCGGKAERETDTMDTFLCSSWYYLRFTDPNNKKEFAGKDKLKNWMPVDMYIGGAEHSVLHLLYSRFFVKALKGKKYLAFDEPFMTLRHQGTIVGADGQKMSKSIGNVVNPDEEVKKIGADAVRLYLGFMGPYDQGGPWNPKSAIGISRFLEKVWLLYGGDVSEEKPSKEDEKLISRAIKKVGDDIEEFKFNTAISTLMVLTNELSKSKVQSKSVLERLALIAAPLAPHIAEELWEKLGKKGSIHEQPWPSYDESQLKDDLCTVVVQVNGRVRANIELNNNCTQKEAEGKALGDPNVLKFMEGKKPKKIIYVPNRIINIVI